MTTIRTFVYAALLAVTALNFAPSLAMAEEPVRGKFTLAHEVHWGSALVPAGDYEFSYKPYETSSILTLTKVGTARAGYMLLVVSAEDSKPTDSNRLMLQTIGDGSYVSSMELSRAGTKLYFSVPSHVAKQLAKATTTVASSGSK
jgi:hypothetical protein